MEPSFWAASRATRENAVTAGAPLPKAHDEPDVSKSKQTQLPPTLAELKRVGEQFSRELKSADCIIAELDTSSLEVGYAESATTTQLRCPNSGKMAAN